MLQRETPNLNLPHNNSESWFSIGGMSWTQLIHTLQLQILFQPPQKVIMICVEESNILPGHVLMLAMYGSIFRKDCIG